jgi:flagellar biosynthesis/type III secretory pathway chaperone
MNSDISRHLEGILDRQIEAAQQLAATLDAETKALTGKSPAAVAEQVAEKVNLLGKIEQLERERRNLWDPTKSDAPESISGRWGALMELMAGCRKVNEINGYIINVRRTQVGQLLDIVRGNATPMIYGPQGKTFATALRALARA